MEVDENIDTEPYTIVSNGWLQLRDNSKIEKFLVEMAPSKINNTTGCLWISVHNQSKTRNLGISNIGELCQEFKQLEVKLGKDMKIQHMEYLARKHNVLCGKWMCSVKTPQVDYVWQCIARAVIKGRLGSSAKVQSSALNRIITHVICVYTNNYLDLEERKMIRDALANVLIESNTFVRRLTYKPDIYTYLGIYGNHSVISAVVDSIKW
ncbi:unnamed protein product [Didymodactylos carnosus]|uniref:Uncharacterized protein n=1 Tax=Didymodactylos carnosus TaxID=1234261 RepID=A0A815ZJE3_9BILA|nr:unnamed protein product [Didymodactylos carnosus]CAF4451474.1 unnamed protein product [Didymodactylos carnosus]